MNTEKGLPFVAVFEKSPAAGSDHAQNLLPGYKAARCHPYRSSRFALRGRAPYSEAPKARASSRAGFLAMSPTRYTPPTSTRPKSRQPMRSHSVS